MPANLTQQYHKAEQAYRQAATPEDELRCLQDMLRELPKHKGTDKLQAELKQKISKAKKEVDSQSRSSKKGHGVRIPRQGAGRIVLIGAPNGGKSKLVGTLTRAEPDVAPYPFTTREPLPAMMPYEDVMVQLIDTPPITRDVFQPYMQGLVRGADLVWFIIDLGSDEGIDGVHEVCERFEQTKTRLGTESHLDETDVGRSYTKTFVVFNKSDNPDSGLRRELLTEFWQHRFTEYLVSAEQNTGLEQLRTDSYKSLDIVRVYPKQPTAKEPDFEKPFTLKRGATLLEFAQLVHKDFANNLKFARVWGSQVHDGTQVKSDYIPHDKDIIELHD